MIGRSDCKGDGISASAYVCELLQGLSFTSSYGVEPLYIAHQHDILHYQTVEVGREQIQFRSSASKQTGQKHALPKPGKLNHASIYPFGDLSEISSKETKRSTRSIVSRPACSVALYLVILYHP
jgi:hypothetical protein